MKNQPENFWNERFASPSYIYGTTPNKFFKSQLDQLKPGKILLPAEGEGRNAVYAASRGWEVVAFDTSEIGRQKAMNLASEQNVNLNYHISDVLDFNTNEMFDVIALIFAHFPAESREVSNRRLLDFLKPGGYVILEGFAKEQLGNPSGGPKKSDMLFSEEEIRQLFADLNVELLEAHTLILDEGDYHQGKAYVIDFIGQKR